MSTIPEELQAQRTAFARSIQTLADAFAKGSAPQEFVQGLHEALATHHALFTEADNSTAARAGVETLKGLLDDWHDATADGKTDKTTLDLYWGKLRTAVQQAHAMESALGHKVGYFNPNAT